MDDLLVISCPRCGREAAPHRNNPHLCVECVKAENNRVSFAKKNTDWLEIAEAADLELWERQPAETDREWQIWVAYRDMYPSVRPSYKSVAEQLSTSVDNVRKISSRWHFPVRMQAWAKHADTLVVNQRRKELLDMNAAHVSLAQKLQKKLDTAIDNLNEYKLKPNELSTMLKTMAELERKARMDQVALVKPAVDADAPELKRAEPALDEMAEIVAVLKEAGLFDAVGVRKTVTTEVVMKND